MFAPWSGDGKISGIAPGCGGLREHRLSERVDVALLLSRAQPTVVALTDRLDRRRQAEDNLLAQAVGSAAAGRVEQPGVERVIAAVAGVFPPRQRRVPVVERGQARHRLPIDAQLRLHGRLADPVLLEGLDVARIVQGVGVLLRGGVPPGAVEALL